MICADTFVAIGRQKERGGAGTRCYTLSYEGRGEGLVLDAMISYEGRGEGVVLDAIISGGRVW